MAALGLLTGMSMKVETSDSSLNNMEDDSLKTEKQYSIYIAKDESIKFSISDEEWCFDKNNQYFKANDTLIINTRDFEYLFNSYEYKEKTGQLRENKELLVPEELNLYHSKSNSVDIKSLMNFALFNLGENNSWWRFYSFNSTNGLDVKMMNLFHDFMRNKITREIIFEAIKQNYAVFNNKITVFQKRLLYTEINELIGFCSNYTANRKKYLKGRTMVTEKPGDYDFSAEYGYETHFEGFLFRRIEFDGISPTELAQFLRELKTIIFDSYQSSDYNSTMSCAINGGKLKINSYVNAKNNIGFLIRSNATQNTYFVPSASIKMTKLEIKGKDFWRIVFDYGKQFITLDEHLNKI